jgi:hypothetical protein
MAVFVFHIFTVIKLPPTQNPRGKIPGAGRRVQCGAQPDEASNTLTRRTATYHHASDSRAGKWRNCGWIVLDAAGRQLCKMTDDVYLPASQSAIKTFNS